jgi:tol-pal system protein YbgF|tara:strand:+ start:338 stop:1051 length:714 start_codon:yes stop_codon:yes gene_type:complete
VLGLNKKLLLLVLGVVVLSGCAMSEEGILSSIMNSSNNIDQKKTIEEIEIEINSSLKDIENLEKQNEEKFNELASRINQLEQILFQLVKDLQTDNESDTKVMVLNQSKNDLGREEYQLAFELLKDENYETARDSFIEFIRLYQDSDFVDDAKYWLGETYYAQRFFTQALKEFEEVLTKFPNSGKIPEALLKKGFCYFELGEVEKSRQLLKSVVNQYPDSSVSRLAVQKLKMIVSVTE